LQKTAYSKTEILNNMYKALLQGYKHFTRHTTCCIRTLELLTRMRYINLLFAFLAFVSMIFKPQAR